MGDKTVIGHIECPSCGSRMRVTLDKNGEPFGFCHENDLCRQQLRVGGYGPRVRGFLEHHGLRLPGSVAPASVVGTAKAKPVTDTGEGGKKVEPKPVTDTGQKPASSLPGPFDFLTRGATA